MLLRPARPKPDDEPQLARPVRNGERLRLGLTGLGAIFLIVMMVAAGLKPAARPSPADPGNAAPQGESLAVLGVAPGAGQTGPTADAPPPAR